MISPLPNPYLIILAVHNSHLYTKGDSLSIRLLTTLFDHEIYARYFLKYLRTRKLRAMRLHEDEMLQLQAGSLCLGCDKSEGNVAHHHHQLHISGTKSLPWSNLDSSLMASVIQCGPVDAKGCDGVISVSFRLILSLIYSRRLIDS